MDKKTIRAHVLKNAISYNGKANINSVLGKLITTLNIKREDIKKLRDIVENEIKEVNSKTLEQQQKEFNEMENLIVEGKREVREGLKELKNVSGKVVMRLAPFPSGPLHIGNARTAVLNDEYVKMYGGKLILVIDDTIGSEQKPIAKEAYKLIPEGLKWLEVKFDKEIIYKSDRLDIYYKYAEELIKKDKAYICSCKSEDIRKNRENKQECKCRSNSVDENLKKWKLMFKAKEGSQTLRIKTDMSHKNPAFRDRVIFRISDREHPKVKKKYRVWPMLDFSWAIDDHLLKITHILRGKDLMIESEMEKYIWDIFGWKHSEIIYNGLLSLQGVKISKSKSGKEVKSGEYSGWDDPRTWSLQSLEKRGIKPEALRKFLLKFGVNATEITAPVEDLYKENKKIIDKEANRYFFVENPKKIKIVDAPELFVKAPLHPDFESNGYRRFETKQEFYVQDEIKKNTNYRFIHLFNFKNNEFLSQEYDPKLNVKLIHWLPVSKDLINIEILMPDGSIKKGLGEESIKNVKVGEVIQFERFAFCCLNKKEKNKYIFWFSHK